MQAKKKRSSGEKKSVCGIECHQAAAQNPNEWQPKCWRLKSFLAVSCAPSPSDCCCCQPVATSGRCQRKWKLCQMRHAKEKEEKTKREQLHATSLTKRQFKHRRSCVGSERETESEREEQMKIKEKAKETFAAWACQSKIRQCRKRWHTPRSIN